MRKKKSNKITMEMNWVGLAQWKYRHHYWHYYNTSPPLYPWLYSVRYFINFIQLFPVIFGLLLFRFNKTNDLLPKLKQIGDFIVYLDFSPSYVTATFLFIVAIVSSIYLFAGYFSKSLMFNFLYVSLLRFYYEILLPILFCISIPNLHWTVGQFMYEKGEAYAVGLSCASSIYFLLSLTISSLYRSRTIYIAPHLFASWDSWIDYFKMVFPELSLMLVLFSDMRINRFMFSALMLLFGIFSLSIDANMPYLHQGLNVFNIAFSINIMIVSVLNILEFAFPSSNYTIYLFLWIILLFPSFFSAIKIYNYQSHRFLSLIDSFDESDEELELDSNDGANDGQTPDFPRSLIRKNVSVHIMRHLLVSGGRSALDFALFMLDNPRNPSIIAESIRIILLLNMLQPDIITLIVETEQRAIPIYCRQMLCDCQYEAIGMETNYDSVEPFINSLDSYGKVIRDSLYAIIKEIQVGHKKIAREAIAAYSTACREYEIAASMYLIHSPNSSVLSQHLAHYYIQTRGDYSQGKIWQQRAERLENSPSKERSNPYFSRFFFTFTTIRSRLLASASSPHSGDTTAQNRLKSQDSIQRIPSKALRYSVLMFAIVFFLLVFNIFYRVNPKSMQYVFSYSTTIDLNSIFSMYYNPLIYGISFGLEIISQQNSVWKDTIDKLLSVVDPLKNKSSFINAIQHNNDLVASISDTSSPYTDILYESWGTDINKSDQVGFGACFLSTEISMLLNLVDSLSINNKSVDLLKQLTSITIYTMDIMEIHYQNLLDFINSTTKDYFRFSIIYYSCMYVIILLILVALNLFATFMSRNEYEKFWYVYLEVDDKSLENFQSSLCNPSFIRADHSDNSEIDVSRENHNILTEDEIELKDDEPIVLPQDEPDEEDISNVINTTSKWHPRYPLAFMFYSILLLIFVAILFILQVYFTRKLMIITIKEKTNLQTYSNIYIRLIKLITLSTVYIATPGDIQYQNYILDQTNHWDYNLSPIRDIFVGINDDSPTYKEIISSARQTLINLGSWKDNPVFSQIFSVYFNHAINSTKDVIPNLREEQISKYYEHRKGQSVISHSTGLVLALFIVLYTGLFVMKMIKYHDEFLSMKSILLLLPSPYFATVNNLIRLFENPSNPEEKSVETMKFQSRYIIKQSLDAILVIDANQKIQDVNKATEEMLGYKKDELIDEPIQSIIYTHDEQNPNEAFSDQQSGGFFSQLAYFNRHTATSGNSAPRFNLQVIRSDRTLTPVTCTLIFIQSNEADSGSPAFAIILRDRTAFNEQEKKLQETKKAVETLLYRILPRVMATKLLSHNPQLHSKIDKATIIFIGIVNFLDWCKSHKNNEIMDQLDVIFSMFDQFISRYNTLVKLKVINGVYMAAGGLFNEVSDKSHALESVEFAVTCAKSIHERNVQVGSDLQLVIGINTGGPIIAGILGIDKPLFDIWGDAVNVSARLETSSLPNQIQMSLETKEALPEGMFPIHERTGVFLKGKGNATTYCIDFVDIYDT